MNKKDLKKTLQVAKFAAMEAGNHALKKFRKIQEIKEKPVSSDEVTSVDIENEKIIVDILKKNFSQHTILTEERQLPIKKKKYIWWVDPLDGTVSYFFGLPHWGVTLALIEQSQPIVGVIYFPMTKDLYWAIYRKGAFCNNNRIHVSGTKFLSDGVVGIDFGYRTEREQGVKDVSLKLIDKVKYPVSYACMTASLVLVAEGKLTAHIHHMARRFDHAAGALLVTEAGGMVSDTQGKAINWRNTDPVHLISSNTKTHKQIVSILR
jgi:myo-inositol-1(or 4)-monophosphatase